MKQMKINNFLNKNKQNINKKYFNCFIAYHMSINKHHRTVNVLLNH